MKFDDFAARFENREDYGRCGEPLVEGQAQEVALVATVVAVTNENCCIDINGAAYEIAGSDVIDIELIPPTDSGTAKEQSESESEDAESGEAEGGKDSGEVSADDAPKVAVIKLNGNAILWRRLPVQAASVAAAGTWVSVTAAAVAA